MKELKSLNILYTKESIDEEFLLLLKTYIKNIKEIENINSIHNYSCDILITNNNSDLLHTINELKSKRIQLLVYSTYAKEIILDNSEFVKYITKNSSNEEILNFLKKSIKNIDSNQSNIINLLNDFIFDSYNFQLYKKKKVVACSKKELVFLDFIIQNKNKVVTYDDINKSIWEGNMTNDALRSIVKELRKKTYKELIKNVSGMGYRINI